MIKPSFSTVACPDWTLDEVAANAVRFGFEGVELRTFGERGSRLACDPALTSEEKARSMFHAAGIEILSLGTSVSFDAPIRPPVVGLVISDTEKSVREAKRAVDMAVALECPFVRVFGFDLPAREKRKTTVERIGRRLAMVADHAAKTGVRLAIENAGAFGRSTDLAELIDAARSPLVGACYSVAAGVKEGEDVGAAIAALGSRLWVARIKDLDKNGQPCALGKGVLPCRVMVGALIAAGFDGPLVYEWDRLWFPGLAPASEVLPAAAQQMFHWVAESIGNAGGGRIASPARASR